MDKKEIQKPVTLVKQEFTESLVQLVNNSNLPLFLVEYILKDVLSSVHSASQQQLEIDMKAYQEQVEKAK